MDSPQSAEFWAKTMQKAFWLGVAFVGLLGVNTVLDLTEKSPNEQNEDTSEISIKQVEKSNDEKIDAERTLRKKVTSSKFQIETEMPSKDDRDMKAPTVKSIVFTGGPCGGKTTALSQVSECLKDLGNGVICVPEAATLIFSSGTHLFMDRYTPSQAIEFQKCLMSLQINLEEIFKKIISINAISPTVFALCDRGLMDGSAYLPREQWEVLLNELGYYEAEIKLNRYDLVIHLTTAADGAEAYYTLANNKARHETVKEAIDLDRKLRFAWLGHPKQLIITNDYKDFTAKIRMAEDFVLRENGHPTQSRYTKKYLLVDNGLFEKVVSNYKLEVFCLTDTFLEGLDSKPTASDGSNEEIFVRKRENNSRLSFLQGKRVHNKNKVFFTTKRNISWKEYQSLIENNKNSSNALFRRRCMALLGSMYLTFDEIKINGLSFILMLVQANERFDKFKLEEQLNYIKDNVPAFITQNILQEVTDTVPFRFSEMAKPTWAMPEEYLQKFTQYLAIPLIQPG